MKLNITETVRWSLDTSTGLLERSPLSKVFRVSILSTTIHDSFHQALEAVIHDLVNISRDNK